MLNINFLKYSLIHKEYGYKILRDVIVRNRNISTVVLNRDVNTIVEDSIKSLMDSIDESRKKDLSFNSSDFTLSNLQRYHVGYLHNLISTKIMGLNNESSLHEYESIIKSLDLKSRGYINSTDPSTIPLIKEVWSILGFTLKTDKGRLPENEIRFMVHIIYMFITVLILQNLMNKIVFLCNNSYKDDIDNDKINDFKALLNNYLRVIDPRIRKFLKGSRINVIDKIYSGYDTEYETIEYAKVKLLSTQLSSTGTIAIRVTNKSNESDNIDFSKVILPVGDIVKDYDYNSKVESNPSLFVLSLIIKNIVKDLRTYTECSSNSDFVKVLNNLTDKGLLIKSHISDETMEYMVPLKTDDNGISVFVNDFEFVNPDSSITLTSIVDRIVNSTASIREERVNYLLTILNEYKKLNLDDFRVVTDMANEIMTVSENMTDENMTGENMTGENMTGENMTVINEGLNRIEEVIPSTEGLYKWLNEIPKTVKVNTDVVALTVYEPTIENGPSIYNTLVNISEKPLHVFNLTDLAINPFDRNDKQSILTDYVKKGGVVRGDYRKNIIVYMGCHFSIADISVLDDFPKIKNNFDSVQNTLVTVSKPISIRKGLTLNLRDTMLLSPAGKHKSTSLQSLGKLYKIPKINIGDYINRMSDLRNDNPVLFKEYGLRDTEITLRHLIEMEKFSYRETGVNIPPTTLSSLSRRFVLKFWENNKIDMKDFIYFGKYKVSEFDKLFTPKGIQSTGNVGIALPLFIAGFRGGRNESFAYGIDRIERWYDYDIISAYTTAMSLLGIPNFSKMTKITDNEQLEKFLKGELQGKTGLGECYSIFKIGFKFPENTMYPCLPVSIEDTSTLYPLQGESIVTGYEIYLASLMNCKIDLKEGIILPFKENGVKPYFEVIKYLQGERGRYDKDALYNLLYKELGNSLYGQTAQGLGKIRKYNSRLGKIEEIGSSIITNPVISSHISGFIRAVLGEVLLQTIKLGGKVISCTTDGLITDIESLPSKLNYNSKIMKLIIDTRIALSENFSILELKSSSKGIISWCTRGQLGLEKNTKISAMTGFQPKNYTMKERVNLIEKAFENEEYNIFFGQESLRKATDIYKNGGHVTSKITEKYFRVVFDNRRLIVDNEFKPFDTLLFTVPIKDREQGLTIKYLGTLGKDIYAPKTDYHNKSGSKNFLDIAIRMFIRALTQSKLNLVNDFNNYTELSVFINSLSNVKITENYIATQKRREFIPRIVPRTRETIDFSTKLKEKYNEFDIDNYLKS